MMLIALDDAYIGACIREQTNNLRFADYIVHILSILL